MWPFLVLFASLGLPALSAVYRPPSCSASEFACSDGCVSLDRLCDGARDCADGSDERACAGNSSNSDLHGIILHRYTRQSGCRMDQFRCKDGTCISFDGKCDGRIDCPDRSDETHALCRKMPCQSNLFRCTYGACVDGTAPCNGESECADNSDELTPRCRNEVRESNGRFTCASGAQIPATDLCDGIANCADASDETLSACASVRCAYTHLFQCAYGACVDAGADCNNHQDCYDGSDEADELCNWNSTLTTTQSSLCKLPSYPANGKYNVYDDASAIPGNLRKRAILTVFCNQGHELTGPKYVECQDGVWKSEMPRCVRYCPLNPHQSVTYYCGSEECGRRVLANTVVTPACKRPNYYSNAIDVNMRCLDSGSFDRVATCNPECGTTSPEGDALVLNGTRTEHGQFPWHAAIYDKSFTPYQQICGGTLVSTTVVLTAAHCFYVSSSLQPASSYAVALGKIYRPWNNSKEVPHKSDVADIKIPPQYSGSAANFQSDIAVVRLSSPVQVTPYIRPACLDFQDAFDEQQLQHGNLGRVAGFGLTETGKPSPVLLYSELPYVDFTQCSADMPSSFRPFITSDKICAGTLNGTALCKGDSGGGLVFPHTEYKETRYYLRGIVSTAPKKGEECNPNTYTTFTHIQKHDRYMNMGGEAGRTSQFAAAVLIVVNLVAMILCGVVFAFSLWVIASPGSLSVAIDKIDSPVVKTLLAPQSLTVSLGVALAVLALFFFFVSFMGLYGAITKSQFLMFMYSALIILLLLLECALFYYFSSTLLEKGLQNGDGQWTHALRVAFGCCENTTNIPEEPKLPWSCCGREYYPDNCTMINRFQKDCRPTIANWLHRYQTAVYASLAATHIILASCSLLRRSRSYS